MQIGTVYRIGANEKIKSAQMKDRIYFLNRRKCLTAKQSTI